MIIGNFKEGEKAVPGEKVPLKSVRIPKTYKPGNMAADYAIFSPDWEKSNFAPVKINKGDEFDS